MKKLLSETEMKAFGKKMDELSEVFNCLDKVRTTFRLTAEGHDPAALGHDPGSLGP